MFAVAREVLRQPPFPATPGGGRTEAGASHASALNILGELGTAEDAEAIASALGTDAASSVVRERAVDAAGPCLERWETPDGRVVAALEELIFDDSAGTDLRVDAVHALFGLDAPPVTAVLVRTARSAPFPVQVEAAVGLTYEHLVDRHGELLREVVASWPREAGERAGIVRDELGG
ncbi:HEAT repeat domain-containing protein [Streptomyces sp. I05A-00742]|uniref:HEAT repeat domain-containing protein n=1 Tax=Streptomyces sp. I05A-00742 TaxID=2732853 RepID=UPI0014886292|nr:hypothetical protein [Streptomyces sp. I05A-00742]